MDFQSTLFKSQGRRIGIVVPTVVVSETHTDTLEITEHPVESGSNIADHAYLKPAQVKMDVGFAGGGAWPFDAIASMLTPPGPAEIYQQLLDLQASRTPLDVVTGKRKYQNMLIQSMEVTTDNLKENVLRATLTLREVRISQSAEWKAAEKNDMSQGVSTSGVQNAGEKMEQPASQTATPLI